MDGSFSGLITLPSENAGIFNATVASSSLPGASSREGQPGQGCLVLEQKVNPENNMDIVTKETHLWISAIILAGVVPLLFLVGVPGNILSAAVFYKQGLRERINLCIFCLALVDLIVLSVTFFLLAEKVYRLFVGPSNFFIRYFVGLTSFTWVSMFLSAVIAAERCFCVVSPLRAQRMLSTRTLAVIITTISLLLLAGMMAIAGPKHTEACLFDPQTNRTSLIIYVTEYYLKNKKTLDIIDTFVYATALPATIFLIIIVTTIVTAIKLQSAVNWRQQSSSASGIQPTGSSDKHMVVLTRMLIATSVLFIVCTFPTLVFQVTIFLVPELMNAGRYRNLRDVFWNVIMMFRCVNSSLNFFVYYYMGSRFRQTLKQLLSCKIVNVALSYPVDSISKSGNSN
ncbi:galanin receptor 2a-like [Babylonia areolata]|uniref:galanin receptor 2a-like n=1 Tax=Babylonia areolata TaxID=304850 RepID=UPI003FD26323